MTEIAVIRIVLAVACIVFSALYSFALIIFDPTTSELTLVLRATGRVGLITGILWLMAEVFYL